MNKRVDFPDPEGPVTVMKSPEKISRFMECSMVLPSLIEQADIALTMGIEADEDGDELQDVFSFKRDSFINYMCLPDK